MGSLCCNAHQIDVIVAVCAYTVLILGTWRVDAVVKPFKLLAVFPHAAGAWYGSSSRWASGPAASATLFCTSAAI